MSDDKPRKRKKPSGGPRKRRGEPKLSSPRDDSLRAAISPRAARRGNGSERVIRDGRVSRFSGIVLSLLVVGMGIILYFAYDLPSLDELEHVKKNHSITVKSEDGRIVGTYGDVYGHYLSYEQLPQSLLAAVLATEDRDFFHHIGVDLSGIARAMFANMKAGHIVQGGSTITQQLAKNIFLTPERTLHRKIQELLLALWLEARFSKEELIAIYLNRIYLGAGSYGVDAASRRYFDKSGRELTLAESAIIAGLLKAPSRYAPTNNPILAVKRAEQVLVNMVDAKMLAPDKAEQAKAALPQSLTASRGTGQGSMYFTDWVVDTLPDYIGNIDEDVTVISTLDPKLQQAAEEVVEKTLAEKAVDNKISQAALVAIDRDGAVVAMVGGRSYLQSQYNRAVQMKRQPGSSFKLFVYLAALSAGADPESLVEDKPVSFGRWHPQNYGGGYQGVMSLRDAFAHSVNTVSVQLAAQVGIDRVIDVARDLGITGELEPNLSLALGTNDVTLLELTTAYDHMASNGEAVFPYGVKEIHSDKGKILYKRFAEGRTQVIGADIVAMMNNLLMAVIDYGTAGGAGIGRPAGGKTGTTQDYKDAWFIGFVPQMTTGVWVGNDDNAPMNKVTGGRVPAMMWKNFMTVAMAGREVQSLPSIGSSSSFGQMFNFLGIAPQPGLPPVPNDNQRPVRQKGVLENIFDHGEVEYDYPDSRRHR